MARQRKFGAVESVIAAICMADRAPSSRNPMGSEGIGVELGVYLRPLPEVVGGCPLSEVSVVVEPRWILKFSGVLDNQQLVCDEFGKGFWVL